MRYVIPPAGATDEQVEDFLASLRAEARDRVRKMLADGAPEDEVYEYLTSLEQSRGDSSDSNPSSPDPV
jgi:hypothetical protein